MSFAYPLKPSLRVLASRLAKIEVMIVDQDLQISSLVREVLRYIGFDLITIMSDGKAAAEELLTREYDLLITDWHMERLNGLELVHKIRTAPNSPNAYLPVIMLTGKAERSDVEAARDAGITEFLVKPFSAKSLYERLVLVIENPRSFIISQQYVGPERRRRTDIPPQGIDRRTQSPV